jgi:signal transduction histidine kinase
MDRTIPWAHPEDLPVISMDRGKLHRILSNVIENAIKFTEAGEVAVSTKVLLDTRTLEVKVADTGMGIAEDQLASIFEMFHHVDSADSRAYGGVGLGLYIAKKFTVLLGGAIEVESMVGQGSVFTIRMPFEVSAAAIPEASPAFPKEFTVLR